MPALAALRDGITRVNRAPAVLACVLLITLLTALPFSLFIRNALEAHLGNSMIGEQAATGLHVQWWSEFTAQAGPLGQTFQPRIIGFAAVLDNLSALVDGDTRPAPILWLGAFYLLVWLFLSGGILDRYGRTRPTNSHEFFTACGVFFVRFLRLAPFMALAYYMLFAIVRPFLLDETFASFTRDVTAERTAFFMRLGLYALFGALLLAINVIFDYAKVRAVVEDRRSMVGATVAGARFVRRNAGAVAALYVLTGVLFIVLLFLYALVAPGASSTGVGVWIGVIITQLFLVGRLWIRLVFFASETALFQGRLAHAGYIAHATAARREPPIVENAV